MKEYITSKSNEQIKTIRKLASKKYRSELGRFVIEGHKLVSEYIKSGFYPVKIYITESAFEKYSNVLVDIKEEDICLVTEDLYLYASTEQAPQGILAVCALPEVRSEVGAGSVIILESIRDAGNLGTIIRTAGALGVDNILMSSDCADIYNPKTLRAAMGAVFYANIFVTDDVVAAVNELVMNGRRVFAAMPSQSAVDVRKTVFRCDDCVIIGNEGHGISDELSAVCSGYVTIPMIEGAESLNASVAAGVLMWELVRGKDNA